MTLLAELQERHRMIPNAITLRQQIQEFLADYKTVASKRAAMTREIKEQMYFVTSLQESYDRREKKVAWHLGIRYYKFDIEKASQNLNILLEIKASL